MSRPIVEEGKGTTGKKLILEEPEGERRRKEEDGGSRRRSPKRLSLSLRFDASSSSLASSTTFLR